VELLADGRVFTGQQAKDTLLVDELGDLHAAVKIAADMSGIQEPHRLVEPSRDFSFRDFMQNQFLGNHGLFPTSTGLHLMYLMAF
jgi:protease-4